MQQFVQSSLFMNRKDRSLSTNCRTEESADGPPTVCDRDGIFSPFGAWVLEKDAKSLGSRKILHTASLPSFLGCHEGDGWEVPDLDQEGENRFELFQEHGEEIGCVDSVGELVQEIADCRNLVVIVLA